MGIKPTLLITTCLCSLGFITVQAEPPGINPANKDTDNICIDTICLLENNVWEIQLPGNPPDISLIKFRNGIKSDIFIHEGQQAEIKSVYYLSDKPEYSFSATTSTNKNGNYIVADHRGNVHNYRILELTDTSLVIKFEPLPEQFSIGGGHPVRYKPSSSFKSTARKEIIIAHTSEKHLEAGVPVCYLNERGDTIIPFGKYEFCQTDTISHIGFVYENSPGKNIVCIDNKGKKLFNVFRYDNGPDYISEGLFRITDEKGLIGYADSAGNIIIPPQFSCAFPFMNKKARVACNGKFKPVPESSDEKYYWDSDQWFFIDRTGKRLNQFSIMDWIPERMNDDPDNKRYIIFFSVLNRPFYLPYEYSDKRTEEKIRKAITDNSMLEITLLNGNTIIHARNSYKERPAGMLTFH